MLRILTIALLLFQLSSSSLSQTTSRIGRYTGKDWGARIDSIWGEGLSTSDKLGLFDAYWNTVDQTWGGFWNLDVNWDSLKNVYRPIVAAGVSRGRFYGILSRLTRALNEWHVFTIDRGIDGTFGYDFMGEWDFWTSFTYRSGIPLVNANAGFFRTCFGAGVTALSDGSALVYSVMPNHPLGLQPGDIILGYDGIPWKNLFRELLEAELPIMAGGLHLGSSPEASSHVGIMSAGSNWGLFDTIDVYRYATKDIVHFPTSLLEGMAPPYFVATEQLPVKGVPFPDLAANKFVSYGIIEGTSIGYIYVWDWAGFPDGRTRDLFEDAVTSLLDVGKVTSLILDFRTNTGGTVTYANQGFSHLFNNDPTSNLFLYRRTPGSDHFAHSNGAINANFNPTHLFDRPIAVLTGPLCGSAGDYNAFRMRFHPMARLFGKRTAGAFVGYLGILPWTSSYAYQVPSGAACSQVNNEGVMIHKGVPVDEEVWLTQDGVAKGEDAVVQRALEWINTLAYAYAPVTDRTNYSQKDTIILSVKVRNPLNHDISLTGKLFTTLNTFVDSAQFYNDGLHGDGAVNDSVWGCLLKTPDVSLNLSFNYRIRFTDKTAGTSREIVYKTPVATPVEILAGQIPKEFSLLQNYPNPFNPATVISFQLPVTSYVTVRVYDLLGREVAVLVNEKKEAGRYSVQWDASARSSGIYFYTLQAGGYRDTKRMLLLK